MTGALSYFFCCHGLLSYFYQTFWFTPSQSLVLCVIFLQFWYACMTNIQDAEGKDRHNDKFQMSFLLVHCHSQENTIAPNNSTKLAIPIPSSVHTHTHNFINLSLLFHSLHFRLTAKLRSKIFLPFSFHIRFTQLFRAYLCLSAFVLGTARQKIENYKKTCKHQSAK